MRNWTISKRLILNSSILIAFGLITGAIGIWGISRMSSSLQGVAMNSVPGLITIGKVKSAVLEIRGSSLLLASYGMPEYKTKSLNRVAELEKVIPALLQAYDQGGGVTPGERPYFQKVQSEIGPFLAVYVRYRELASAGKIKEASDLYSREATVVYPGLRDAMEAELTYSQETAAAHLKSGLAAHTASSWLSWGSLFFSILAGGALAYLVIRSINNSLSHSSDEIRVSAESVTSASAQIASSSQILAQGANQQAVMLEQTSASSQEISSMTQRNAENSRNAVSLMEEVDRNVAAANKTLAQMVASMAEISSSSERIAKIIKVIDEIAFQTNILALNAAVEAARAGEAGLGFAVVADEVRNLAQRCAQAAKDTTALIEESVSSARSGNVRLDEVTEVVQGVTRSARQVKALIDEVSLASSEQARGIDQIARSLGQMEKGTQQSATNAEESASASQELKSQSESMMQIVVALESLVSDRTHARTAAVPFRRTTTPMVNKPHPQIAGPVKAIARVKARQAEPVMAGPTFSKDEFSEF